VALDTANNVSRREPVTGIGKQIDESTEMPDSSVARLRTATYAIQADGYGLDGRPKRARARLNRYLLESLGADSTYGASLARRSSTPSAPSARPRMTGMRLLVSPRST
jgi:hypothetical protein